jgi:hypothetical protein
MITIAGSVHRSFIFPANFQTAFAYYSDFRRTLSFLDHISVTRQYAEDEYRMLYSATELGIYRVRIICDMKAEIDRRQGYLRVHPLEGIPPIQSKAGLYFLSGQGYYNSESIFNPDGDKTKIEYKLRLHARVPIPIGLRFMPIGVINEIARNITQWRITEIAEGFIERSLRAFGAYPNDTLTSPETI